MSKKWLLIPILLIFIFAISITGLAQYKYTQQSGTGYFVSEADHADALENQNELRMILDELGLLLEHSKYGDASYPADENTTPGTLDVFDDYLQNITSESIGDLSDVDTTGVADNKILKYDIATSKWIIADDEDTGTTYTAGTGLDLTGTVFSLDASAFDLNDFPADPDADRYLFWNDTTGALTWAAAAGGGASQLSDLSDVNTSTPTDKYVLIADGVDFESRQLTSDDLSDVDTLTTKSTAEQTIYCNYSTGSDTTGDGSSGSPYKTIQAAVDSLPDIVTEDTIIAVGASETATSDAVDFSGITVTGNLTIIAQDSSDNPLYKTGMVTSSTTTSITDSAESWDTDEWAGGMVVIYDGVEIAEDKETIGEQRTIISNTSDTLTINSGAVIESGTLYLITKVVLEAEWCTFFSNIPDNLTIKGFQFSKVFEGASCWDSGSGSKNLTVEGCYFKDTNGSAVALVGFRNTYMSNCFVEVKGSEGIYLIDGDMYVYKTAFMAANSGIGTGILVDAGAFVDATTPHFINLDVGIEETSNGVVFNKEKFKYVNCDVDYTIDKTNLIWQAIVADDTTPDVRSGSIFITSANTGATAITDLDNPTVGETITIIGGSDTNPSTIADSGNFKLSGDMTLGLDDSITLFVKEDNYYIELSRSDN